MQLASDFCREKSECINNSIPFTLLIMDYLSILKIKYNPLLIVHCTVEGCNFSPASTQQLLRHFRSKHEKNTKIQSACLYSRDCHHTEKFKTFSGLISRLQRWHRNFFTKDRNWGTDIEI